MRPPSVSPASNCRCKCTRDPPLSLRHVFTIMPFCFTSEAGASAVFSTTRSDEKCQFCVKELGAKASYNTADTAVETWDKRLLRDTENRGVDVIVDFIGPDTFGPNLNAVSKSNGERTTQST